MSALSKLAAFLIGCCTLMSGCTSKEIPEWQQEDGYRWAEVDPGFWDDEGFRMLLSSNTGIIFRNDVSEELRRKNRHYLNGSGVAVADVDGDGLVDIYFAAIDGPNKLYKNLGGFQFEDITQEAGVAHEGFNSTGVVFSDINGDGNPDLLITSLSDENCLYINDGNGRFTLKKDSGLGKSRGAHTMAIADINRDGLPDLYIANYKIQTVRDMFSARELSMENTVEIIDGTLHVIPAFSDYFTIVETEEGPFRNEIGGPDELYLNIGNGRFERVNPLHHFFDEDDNPTGLSPDWGLTATFRDVNEDGLPDLYVANDFWTPDRFWINRGDGTFKAIEKHAIRNMSFSSMGVDFSDINRDGHIDFVVTEMLSRNHSRRLRQSSDYLPEYQGKTLHNRNSVYLNRGDMFENEQTGTFAQIAYYSGLEASEWSWATRFLDVDLDGYEDLIVTTGFGNDYQDMDTQVAMYELDRGSSRGGADILKYPRLELPNKVFKNNGDLTFSDVSDDWGFDSDDISHGMAMADLDNDGDHDLILNRMDDEAAVYENRSNASRIAVQVKGVVPNTQGIGAKVELKGGPVQQVKEITAGGNYLSGSQTLAVFAANDESDEHSIIVTWPDGRKSLISNVSANRIYEIDQSSVEIFREDYDSVIDKSITPIFRDVSDELAHRHQENDYNDFRFSPLLPAKISSFGPGVAWFDVNGDENDDLFITSGKDGRPVLLTNNGNGSFTHAEVNGYGDNAPGDQTAILGWKEDEKNRIVVGSANYEQGNPNVPAAFVYDFSHQAASSATSGLVAQVKEIPGIHSTTGPIAAADYTGDGFVDLFIGGRFKPGQYPVDADSRLFRNNRTGFDLDAQNSERLTGVGLVTDALFVDMNGNGRQDLLISTEWGTLKLFENRGGRFIEVTNQVGLNTYKGWWNGIAVGDFTGNGLPDIVALNIGLNSSYQLRGNRAVRMYYDDFNWDRRLDILETYYSEEENAYVPRRKLHQFESVPTILSNVRSHAQFSEATIEEIFAQSFERVPFKEINTLEHVVFINTGTGFEAKPLPTEAQFSMGFYAGVSDFDNDGHEDLFIGQNFFGFSKNTPRLDAGRGLLLKGDGTGNFMTISGNVSGIKIYGEQRGAALGDFNGDGRTDLAVSQNNGQTKLFENQVNTEGIKVKLTGPQSNLNAVGSSLRLIYQGGKKGPRRFVQAGGGYGSQNSYTQVLGVIEGEFPLAVEITWPNGSVERVEIQDRRQLVEIEIGSE
ncbi:FG-GAP-like repeat-containing protein [Rhodohalobacter sp. 614A]|uniref:FG-GAP-like repeat-containing protein n=1 Tax=Rhodohalobacter sp. 614A TaxID=2908649 RepID=UPI001F15CF19|nr:FG-GAP-like repeat-containing protein [Rhodohalobacter sp. 614A]